VVPDHNVKSPEKIDLQKIMAIKKKSLSGIQNVTFEEFVNVVYSAEGALNFPLASSDANGYRNSGSLYLKMESRIFGNDNPKSFMAYWNPRVEGYPEIVFLEKDRNCLIVSKLHEVSLLNSFLPNINHYGTFK